MKFILNDENYKEKEYVLTEEDLKAVRTLMKEKYSTWEWNYGESPAFEVEKARDIQAASFH